MNTFIVILIVLILIAIIIFLLYFRKEIKKDDTEFLTEPGPRGTSGVASGVTGAAKEAADLGTTVTKGVAGATTDLGSMLPSVYNAKDAVVPDKVGKHAADPLEYGTWTEPDNQEIPDYEGKGQVDGPPDPPLPLDVDSALYQADKEFGEDR